MLNRLMRSPHTAPALRPMIGLRLALCEARLGDVAAARAAYQQVRALHTPPLAEPHWQAVEEILTQMALIPREPEAPHPLSGMGNLRLSDRGQPLVAPTLGLAETAEISSNRVWLRLWSRQYELAAPSVPGTDAARTLAQRPQHRGQLVNRWARMQWKPTAQVVGDGRLMLFRTHRSLMALDAASGEMVWEAREPEPRYWANAGQYTPGFIQRENDRVVPTSPEEILFFGDRLNRAVTRLGDKVVTIEAQVQVASLGQPLRMFPGRMPASLPPNVLAVYDWSTGQLRWRKESIDLEPERAVSEAPPVPPDIPAAQPPLPMPRPHPAPAPGGNTPAPPPPSPYRFVGLPIQVRDQWIVPVEKEDDLSLASLSPIDGKVNWLVPLCQGPLGGGRIGRRSGWHFTRTVST